MESCWRSISSLHSDLDSAVSRSLDPLLPPLLARWEQQFTQIAEVKSEVDAREKHLLAVHSAAMQHHSQLSSIVPLRLERVRAECEEILPALKKKREEAQSNVERMQREIVELEQKKQSLTEQHVDESIYAATLAKKLRECEQWHINITVSRQNETRMRAEEKGRGRENNSVSCLSSLLSLLSL